MGNDRLEDRLAGKATITSGLLLGRSEVMRSLGNHTQAQSQGLQTTDRMKERGSGQCYSHSSYDLHTVTPAMTSIQSQDLHTVTPATVSYTHLTLPTTGDV